VTYFGLARFERNGKVGGRVLKTNGVIVIK
jgi:hypothetical protein